MGGARQARVRAALLWMSVAAFAPASAQIVPGSDAAGNHLPLHRASGAYAGELWFPDGTPVETIKRESSRIPPRQAKTLLRNRIDAWWSVLTRYFPFPDRRIAYAFFYGEATLESTLNPGVETAIADWGVNPAHAYGLFQTAETAYASDFPHWMPEDVPHFPQAPLTPRNFYDPVVSVDMGLRKACWFSLKAREELAAKKGIPREASLEAFGRDPDFWMLVLKGHNTGWATLDVQEGGRWTVNRPWYDFYGAWAPALGAWYLNEGHLHDDAITWHTDGRVAPYLKDPYAWIAGSVGSASAIPGSRRLERGPIPEPLAPSVRADLLGRLSPTTPDARGGARRSGAILPTIRPGGRP